MPPMQTLVGLDGKVSSSCLCISTPEYDEYLHQIYTLYAATEPDFIWTDDDIRHWNHGAAAQHCFCPSCIAKFNRCFGKDLDFDSLTSGLKQAKYKDSPLWNDWMAFIYKEYETLCGKIEKIVHSVDPRIIMGYMGGIYTEIPERITALGAQKCRPGGGVYNDDIPSDILMKAFSIARQTGAYPSHVTDIQYEFENFPNQRLSKSICFSEMECTLAMMSGCNGVAFNACESFMLLRPDLMGMIEKKYPFWDTLEKETAGLTSRGLYVSDFLSFKKFAEIGIPLADRICHADALVLTKETCDLYVDRSADEGYLKQLLSGNVFMDGSVLEYFIEKGLEKYIGVTIDRKNSINGKLERFTDDPLNSPANGHLRDAVPGYYPTQEYILSLRPLTDSCRVLCGLEDAEGRKYGPCMTLYENDLGGKIIVSTYLYPDLMKTVEKRTQMLNVMDYLCGEQMPVRIKNCCRITPIVRASREKEVIMLFNSSLDSYENIELEFRNSSADCSYELICSDGSKKAIPADSKNRITIGEIKAFDVYTIVRKIG